MCALSASLLYALASVLQHRAAIAQPAEHSLRLGLLTRLVRKPLWVIGIACDGLAYLLQFVALGHGSLVLGEGIATGWGPTLLEAIGLAIVTVSVFVLSRAEAVQVAHEETAEV